MSHQDISSHIKELYDMDISSASISAITDKLLPVINEWRSRPLQNVYPIVFLDAMFFKVKGEDGHYASRCLYNRKRQSNAPVFGRVKVARLYF